MRLYVEQYHLIQTLCGCTGVTDVRDITDGTGIAGVMDLADVTDVTDITDISGVKDVMDIMGGTVRHMACDEHHLLYIYMPRELPGRGTSKASQCTVPYPMVASVGMRN